MRAVVVVGRERALVWDTLSCPADMEPVGTVVEDKDVVVVYSHADWDHAWGTAGLARVTEVVAHARTAARLAREAPGELEAKRRDDPERYADVEIVLPTVIFEQTHRLELGGGLSVELRALPGHTPDCIVGLIPELGILLAGDTVETPLPLLNRGSEVGAWILELGAWAEDPRVTLVVPAHGEWGGRDLLRRTAGYLKGLLGGLAEPPAGPLDAFYRGAHERNVKYVRQGEISG